VKKSLVAVWRDSLRDSTLDELAKLVGFVLSTYMNASGYARPGRVALARGCSTGVRTVERRVRVLEDAGFLVVEWSVGGRSYTNAYRAVLPQTASDVRRSEWENGVRENAKRRQRVHETASQGRPKAYESVESGTRRSAGAAARPRSECMGPCGEVKDLYPYRDRWMCLECVLAETGDLEQQLRAHVQDLRERSAGA